MCGNYLAERYSEISGEPMKKKSGYKILIVDDERDFCEMVESGLEGLGLDIRTAYDGDEALSIMKRRKFDLILLDCEMPGISGIELAKKISKEAQKPKLVMITGYNGIRETFTRKIGIDVYLEKPVKIKQIQDLIHTFHQGAKLQ